MGKHGNHPVHQIDAGPPLQGLLVQPGALRHIMADIGDVDTQDKCPILPFGYGDGVVQILGVLPVDGHRRKGAQVQPSGQIPAPFLMGPQIIQAIVPLIGKGSRLLRHINSVRDRGNLFHHLLWKFFRKAVSFYNGENVRSRVVHMAQNLRNLSLRIPFSVSKVHNADHDLMPRHRSHILSLGNKHIRIDSRIVRNHKAEGLVLLVIPDYLAVGVLQHTDHLTLRPFFPGLRLGNHDTDLVSV